MRNAVTGALLIGSAAAWLVYERPWHVPYAHWHEKHVKGKQGNGKVFVHSELRQTEEFSEDECQELRKIILDEGGQGTEITKEQYFFERAATPLVLPEKTFAQYCKKVSAHVSQLFEFLEWNEGLPVLEYYRLAPDTTFKASSEKMLPCYFAADLNGINTLKATVIRGGEEGQGTSTLTFTQYFGEVLAPSHFAFYDISQSTNGNDKIVKEYPLIMISSLDNAHASYYTPLAETLHFALRRIKARGLLAESNEQKRAESYQQNSQAQSKKLFEEWIACEEGIVHALADAFAMQKAGREGLSLENLNVDRYKGNPHYRYLPTFRELLRTTTPAALLREYRENPRGLFSRIQKNSG